MLDHGNRDSKIVGGIINVRSRFLYKSREIMFSEVCEMK